MHLKESPSSLHVPPLLHVVSSHWLSPGKPRFRKQTNKQTKSGYEFYQSQRHRRAMFLNTCLRIKNNPGRQYQDEPTTTTDPRSIVRCSTRRSVITIGIHSLITPRPAPPRITSFHHYRTRCSFAWSSPLEGCVYSPRLCFYVRYTAAKLDVLTICIMLNILATPQSRGNNKRRIKLFSTENFLLIF